MGLMGNICRNLPLLIPGDTACEKTKSMLVLVGTAAGYLVGRFTPQEALGLSVNCTQNTITCPKITNVPSPQPIPDQDICPWSDVQIASCAASGILACIGFMYGSYMKYTYDRIISNGIGIQPPMEMAYGYDQRMNQPSNDEAMRMGQLNRPISNYQEEILP